MSQIIPIARCEIAVREATLDDLPFIDSLQKIHTEMVGWMPTKQIEQKIRLGHVLISEEAPLLGTPDSRHPIHSNPVGYVIATDRYMKREDCGIIYQLNVVPGRRRSLIGATLVKAVFQRAAYGCRLFCCWCAQDIEANWFWESIGFVPLAFRAGSRDKQRTHIFWQRRIRAGDTTTPWWFPSQTTSGSLREDRLVLPIPPGVHWRDVMPVILPGMERGDAGHTASCQIESQRPARKMLPGPKSKARGPRGRRKVMLISLGGLHFEPPPHKALPDLRQKRAAKTRVTKNDPKLVAAARELRDRWLEQVNADPSLLISGGKYDVTRALRPARGQARGRSVERRALPAAVVARPAAIAA